MKESAWAKLIIIMVIFISHQVNLTESFVVNVGVNWGFLGNDLPAPADVVSLLQTNRIPSVRIFEPRADVLNALRKSGIDVSIGVRNEDLANLASSTHATDDWVQTNMVPYKDDVFFKILTVGNEVVPGELAQYVLPAIKNFYYSVYAADIREIFVTTVVATSVLASSFPPSSGVFADQTMVDIVRYLHENGQPIMVNVYPYFALANEPNIRLAYALGNSLTPEFIDSGTNLSYVSLFDAMLDAFVAAISKAVGVEDMLIMVSETGWPSAGGAFTSPENAQIYNTRFRRIAESAGTPRYNRPFHGYIFALFNENQKAAGVEQNFGNFYPNEEPVYSLWP